MAGGYPLFVGGLDRHDDLAVVAGNLRRVAGVGVGIQGNALQVRMELQADCYAGVWANRARNKDGQQVMEPGDMEEAMRAANAIGDDTLMRSAVYCHIFAFASPSMRTCSAGKRTCAAKALPLRALHSRQWQTDTRIGSPVQVMRTWPQRQDAWRVGSVTDRHPIL